MTAPTPTIMPSIVSMERNLLASREPSATRSAWDGSIERPFFPGEAGRARDGRRSLAGGAARDRQSYGVGLLDGAAPVPLLPDWPPWPAPPMFGQLCPLPGVRPPGACWPGAFAGV